MRQCFPSMLPMQLVILQMLLNSCAIRSHSSEVGAAIYIQNAVLSKYLLSYSFQLENGNPKTQMIPQWQDT